MEHVLLVVAEHVALGLEAMAILVIVGGSAQAFAFAMVHMLDRRDPSHARGVWLRYCRWLVAGMTFLIAADAVHTTVAPTWADIGQLAALTGIRTFLSYFLERDMSTHGTEEVGV